MVYKLEEAMKRREEEVKKRQDEVVRVKCRKGTACCRFKRSSLSKEEDGITSAIFLLVCVVCAPH